MPDNLRGFIMIMLAISDGFDGAYLPWHERYRLSNSTIVDDPTLVLPELHYHFIPPTPSPRLRSTRNGMLRHHGFRMHSMHWQRGRLSGQGGSTENFDRWSKEVPDARLSREASLQVPPAVVCDKGAGGDVAAAVQNAVVINCWATLSGPSFNRARRTGACCWPLC